MPNGKIKKLDLMQWLNDGQISPHPVRGPLSTGIAS
jgi:hypothetical protein